MSGLRKNSPHGLLSGGHLLPSPNTIIVRGGIDTPLHGPADLSANTYLYPKNVGIAVTLPKFIKQIT
jgi:hypothetical protein